MYFDNGNCFWNVFHNWSNFSLFDLLRLMFVQLFIEWNLCIKCKFQLIQLHSMHTDFTINFHLNCILWVKQCKVTFHWSFTEVFIVAKCHRNKILKTHGNGYWQTNMSNCNKIDTFARLPQYTNPYHFQWKLRTGTMTSANNKHFTKTLSFRLTIRIRRLCTVSNESQRHFYGFCWWIYLKITCLVSCFDWNVAAIGSQQSKWTEKNMYDAMTISFRFLLRIVLFLPLLIVLRIIFVTIAAVTISHQLCCWLSKNCIFPDTFWNESNSVST